MKPYSLNFNLKILTLFENKKVNEIKNIIKNNKDIISTLCVFIIRYVTVAGIREKIEKEKL